MGLGGRFWLWTCSHIASEDYKNHGRACKEAVKKAKAWLDLKLASDIKNNKKWVFRHMTNEQNHR